MSALLAYPKLTHSRNLRSWLFTIAHNKGIDHFRKASRETLSDSMPDGGRLDDEPRDAELWAQVGLFQASSELQWRCDFSATSRIETSPESLNRAKPPPARVSGPASPLYVRSLYEY